MIRSFSAGMHPWNELSSEVEFLGEHGDHTWDLLLLVEARVIRLRFKAPGHPVIHPGEDLQDFQALSKSIRKAQKACTNQEPLPGFLHEEEPPPVE